MRYLDGHNAYEFTDKAGDGYLIVSATNKGVQFSVKGYSPTRKDYILFGMSIEEAVEIGRISDGLSDLVPSVEAAREEHEREQQEIAAAHAKEFPKEDSYEKRPFVALAPVVWGLESKSDKKAVFKGVAGSLVEPKLDEELVTLGGLTWARDQLILKIYDVDVLLFRPEVFRSLGQIATNQPEFPPETSVWR